MRAPLHGLAFVAAFVTSIKEDKKARDERGAAFTEYVVLLSAIVAIIIGLLAVLGPALTSAIGDIVTALGGA